ncbi:MAG: nitrogen regulation protein NR(I), partial [Betaproteobacteria bacterium HGW-Betaproteobacteria-21]
EIGDMPAELQTRLLRVLSDGNFYRVGGHQPIRANVRVIAATHQDLEERVRQGLFREDLFHRLNVIRLRLPPMRERREDIPILVRHFLQRSAQDLNVESKRISDSALKYLQALPFPGNVRQLENLCHWLTVMAPGQIVEVADLPPEMRDQPMRETPVNWVDGLGLEADRLIAATPGEVFDRLTREFERTLIRRALTATGGRRIEAAQLLGIGRNTITRKIQELGMDDDRPPPADSEHPA